MNIEYLKTESYMDSIDVDRMGQCSVVAYNDIGEAYYLDIRTELGWSKVTEFGPISESGDSPTAKRLIHYEIGYDEKRLYKIIRDFINNSNRVITQAEVIDRDDVHAQLIDYLEKLKGVI